MALCPLFKDGDKKGAPEGCRADGPNYLRRAMTQHESQEARPAVLMLEDGTRFEGNAIGAVGTTTGEVAFNTGVHQDALHLFTHMDPQFKPQTFNRNWVGIDDLDLHV